jgi:hypothetical protein
VPTEYAFSQRRFSFQNQTSSGLIVPFCIIGCAILFDSLSDSNNGKSLSDAPQKVLLKVKDVAPAKPRAIPTPALAKPSWLVCSSKN